MEEYDNQTWESDNVYRTEEILPYEKMVFIRSIINSLVELLNGTITLISKPTQGSEFIIKIPSKPINDPNAFVGDYDIDEIKVDMIEMEFSDMYN